MATTKATVRSFLEIERRNARGVVKLFKIKETLPQQKTANVKKNGQIIKRINVRRNSRSFSGRNRLIF